jgi:hypothetical protein
MISEEMSLEEIKEKFIEKYDVDDLTFEKDFYEFCSLLKHFQITLQSDSLEFN